MIYGYGFEKLPLVTNSLLCDNREICNVVVNTELKGHFYSYKVHF